MKTRFFLSVAFLSFVCLPNIRLTEVMAQPRAQTSVTGAGIGLKLGQVTDYDNPSVRVEGAKFSDFGSYGAFLTFGRSSFGLDLGVDYSSDNESALVLGQPVETKVKDLSGHVTGKVYLPILMARPFVGGGIAIHRISYDYSGDLGSVGDADVNIPEDDSHFGYHAVLGAMLDLGTFPIHPFVEGKFSRINTEPRTETTVISGGVILRFN